MGGASGGYTVGPRAVIDLLRQRSRPYLFSNTMPPAIVAASLTAFQMVMRDPSLIGNLRTNTHLFRSKMTAAGFTLKGTWEHPIAPVMLYDAKLASQFAEEMLGAGINVIGFSFPVRSYALTTCVRV